MIFLSLAHEVALMKLLKPHFFFFFYGRVLSIQALAAQHNIEYRQMDEWPLLVRNLKQYRDVALAPPDLNARLSASGVSV